MDERQIQRRYALALALIPDLDAAGDIFLKARDEEELRLRASRWRERQGLGPAPEVHTLPPLTADDEEHALHLWRRGRRRRGIFLGLAGVLLAALLAALGLWKLQQPTGLALSPAYTGAPVATVEADEGKLKLLVYLVERKGFHTVVWWGAEGPGAAAAELENEAKVMEWDRDYKKPIHTATAAAGRNRLLARSTYYVLGIPSKDTMEMRFKAGGAEEKTWYTQAKTEGSGLYRYYKMVYPRTEVKFPQDSTLTLNAVQFTGPSVGMVANWYGSGDGWIMVNYSYSGPQGWVPPQPVRIEAWSRTLQVRPGMTWMPKPTGHRGFSSRAFDERPPGAVGLKVQFSSGWLPAGALDFPAGYLQDLRREQETVTLSLPLLASKRILPGDLYLVDTKGSRYPLEIRSESEEGRVRRYRLEAAGVPAEAVITGLHAGRVQSEIPPFQLPLDPWAQ